MKRRIQQQGAASSHADGTARAFVHIDTREIGYRRCGRGRPVLVLAEDAVLGDRIRALLGGHFTVIVPEIAAPTEVAGCMTWLPALIDSLGLCHLHLVGAAQYVGPGLHFALGESERVDRIAILWRDPGEEQQREGPQALDDHLRHSGHPLLLLRLPAKREERAAAEGRAPDRHAGSGETLASLANMEALVRFLGARNYVAGRGADDAVEQARMPFPGEAPSICP